MTIAIQGYQGSYHEQAVKAYFGNDAEIVFTRVFPDALDLLVSGDVDLAVMAIANNRYGFIPEPYDLLMQDAGKKLQIIGEHTLLIQHSLLGIEGVKLEDITELHSQTPALGQCRRFIEEHLPHATIIEEDDTALAAKKVAQRQEPHVAAIASKAAGKLHGLTALKESIQDDENNLTRFLVLTRQGTEVPLDANKSSIILETSNAAGSLVDALQLFKDAGINLDLLHSSFIADSEFRMRFFVEFDYAWPSAITQKIIQQLEIQHAEVTFLGSYKSANSERT